ncbi:MAG: hypothetical protein GY750_17230 [Lentisphaerae bacterium]|nr:hypothetical protein [Lentisphaerota bacterium]MCP4103141.1 hypothetical protein [Lentisphaerota bacterium]
MADSPPAVYINYFGEEFRMNEPEDIGRSLRFNLDRKTVNCRADASMLWTQPDSHC